MNVSRSVLVVGGVAILLLLSGCAAFATGSGPLVFHADEPALTENAKSTTEYQLQDRQTNTLNRSVELGGQERRVVMHNRVAVYQRQVTAGMVEVPSMLTMFATPSASVAGEPLNPLARMSNDEIVKQVMQRNDGSQLQDVQKVNAYKVAVGGGDEQVTKYSATVQQDGRDVDVYAHLVTVTFDDTSLVAVAVYPQEIDDSEAGVVRDAFSGLTVSNVEKEN